MHIYLRLNEAAISRCHDGRSRSKRLDSNRNSFIHKLETYPHPSAAKVLRKLKTRFDEVNASDRTLRRYIKVLRRSIAIKHASYYLSVLDMAPGLRCEVDPAGPGKSIIIRKHYGVIRCAKLSTM